MSFSHPLQSGQIFSTPGCCYTYRVVGACCRLFDREELPYPCCRIEWRGKEPSWRRIGRRFVPDLASRQAPSYCVEILGQTRSEGEFVLTLYWVRLSPEERNWWYLRPGSAELADAARCDIPTLSVNLPSQEDQPSQSDSGQSSRTTEIKGDEQLGLSLDSLVSQNTSNH